MKLHQLRDLLNAARGLTSPDDLVHGEFWATIGVKLDNSSHKHTYHDLYRKLHEMLIEKYGVKSVLPGNVINNIECDEKFMNDLVGSRIEFLDESVKSSRFGLLLAGASVLAVGGWAAYELMRRKPQEDSPQR